MHTKDQKPSNIFYIWYRELCRRLNINPTPAIRPARPKCQTILNFVADRLKIDEWNPVINALRQDTSLHVISIRSRIGNCPFLHEIDTEDKARCMKRKYGCLWTAFIMKSLMQSLSKTIRHNDVLTVLEFDGIPLFVQYLKPLFEALETNRTLKCLMLCNSKIGDIGCQMICKFLERTPNIEIINLTGCDLTMISCEFLGKLIKLQQINRYCEIWQNSLRYEDPDNQRMCGIKRLTLNRNPGIGDRGLEFILDELADDLWIKALDMQKCGITDRLAPKILDLINFNRSLEIVDLRLNDGLSLTIVQKIMDLLKQKYDPFKHPFEYQWCDTTCTLTYDSYVDSGSSRGSTRTMTTPGRIVHKSKSVPNKTIKPYENRTNLRKSKTSETIVKNDGIEQKISELNTQLEEERTRRAEMEKLIDKFRGRLALYENGIAAQTTARPSDGQILKNSVIKMNCIQNGFQSNDTKTSSLFETILSKFDEDEDGQSQSTIVDDDDVSGSQASLYQFMHHLGTNGTIVNRRCEKKYE